MKRKTKIENVFPSFLFWDMDVSKLEIGKDKDIIIPRALYATTPETFEEDIERLELIYNPKVILKYLKYTKENISNTVCILVAKRYHVDPFYRYKLTI